MPEIVAHPGRRRKPRTNMKDLLILRHAKSSWKHHELQDHDRPLNGRGRRDAARVGSLLRDEMPQPQLVIWLSWTLRLTIGSLRLMPVTLSSHSPRT